MEAEKKWRLAPGPLSIARTLSLIIHDFMSPYPIHPTLFFPIHQGPRGAHTVGVVCPHEEVGLRP